MNIDTLIQIIDIIFDTIEANTKSRLVKDAVNFIQELAHQFLPLILDALKAKGIAR